MAILDLMFLRNILYGLSLSFRPKPRRRRLAASRPPSLSPELLLHIFSFLDLPLHDFDSSPFSRGDTEATLLSASLVCKAWSGPAIQQLWYAPRVSKPLRAARFIEAFRATPDLASHIRVLQLLAGSPRSPIPMWDDIDLILEIISHCPNLRVLAVHANPSPTMLWRIGATVTYYCPNLYAFKLLPPQDIPFGTQDGPPGLPGIANGDTHERSLVKRPPRAPLPSFYTVATTLICPHPSLSVFSCASLSASERSPQFLSIENRWESFALRESAITSTELFSLLANSSSSLRRLTLVRNTGHTNADVVAVLSRYCGLRLTYLHLESVASPPTPSTSTSQPGPAPDTPPTPSTPSTTKSKSTAHSRSSAPLPLIPAPPQADIDAFTPLPTICRNLEHLEIEGSLASPAFLSALRSHPALRRLIVRAGTGTGISTANLKGIGSALPRFTPTALAAVLARRGVDLPRLEFMEINNSDLEGGVWASGEQVKMIRKAARRRGMGVANHVFYLKISAQSTTLSTNW
ncbi:hypothetical protein BOTBODRAFT_66324 [Botryobasidium botryosum FD-172 SS1]|uniref:F-box domain-containing protein n=1 Tax=Botryobasidium botryosum (strain FD-172 SS1) TaxID=930990 RepID=A0A067MHG2_BOTB1|nr:hypothetical protein BOTBODRAFT_66324 [Botryobasidium botryosum FD-172 SS1]